MNRSNTIYKMVPGRGDERLSIFYSVEKWERNEHYGKGISSGTRLVFDPGRAFVQLGEWNYWQGEIDVATAISKEEWNAALLEAIAIMQRVSFSK